MSYNMTAIWESNNLVDVYSAINTMTSNILSLMILVMLFVITYLNVSTPTYNRKFMMSSLVCTLIGSLMFFGGYITWYFLSIFPLIFLITIVMEFIAD